MQFTDDDDDDMQQEDGITYQTGIHCTYTFTHSQMTLTLTVFMLILLLGLKNFMLCFYSSLQGTISRMKQLKICSDC